MHADAVHDYLSPILDAISGGFCFFTISSHEFYLNSFGTHCCERDRVEGAKDELNNILNEDETRWCSCFDNDQDSPMRCQQPKCTQSVVNIANMSRAGHGPHWTTTATKHRSGRGEGGGVCLILPACEVDLSCECYVWRQIRTGVNTYVLAPVVLDIHLV